MPNQTPPPIEWPTLTLKNGRSFVLKFAYTAHYQLARWKTNIAEADVMHLAAASAGNFTPDGKWRPEGFERAIDLAELCEVDDEVPMLAAVADALKKAYPAPEVSAQPTPGETGSMKTSGLASGHLELLVPASD